MHTVRVLLPEPQGREVLLHTSQQKLKGGASGMEMFLLSIILSKKIILICSFFVVITERLMLVAMLSS